MPPKKLVTSATNINSMSLITPLLLLFIIIVLGILAFLLYRMLNVYKPTNPPVITVINPESPVQSVNSNQYDDMNPDRKVLSDQLYPPYGRPPLHVPTISPESTRGSLDSYRLVGYLVSDENTEDVWKLFGREKYSGGKANFYAVNANKNVEGIKVFLNRDVVSGARLDDIYTIPDHLNVNHPMFSHRSYNVIPLPYSEQDF